MVATVVLSVRPAHSVGSLWARDSDGCVKLSRGPPLAGAFCISGYRAPIRSGWITGAIVAGPAGECPVARRPPAGIGQPGYRDQPLRARRRPPARVTHDAPACTRPGKWTRRPRPAIEDVTACQAASTPVRERPSGLRGLAVATPGVSHGGNVDLAVRPVSVATDVDLLFGPASPAANQAAGLRMSGYPDVKAP